MATPPVVRSSPQIDSKIKQLQSELQHKVQNFDGKRIDPREEYGQQQTEIKKLVKQFDPLCDPTSASPTSMPQRHPSIYQHIPNNHVNNILQNLQNNRSSTAASWATDVTLSFDPLAPTTNEERRTRRNGSNLIDFD